jgi:hypothetical protein
MQTKEIRSEKVTFLHFAFENGGRPGWGYFFPVKAPLNY